VLNAVVLWTVHVVVHHVNLPKNPTSKLPREAG